MHPVQTHPALTSRNFATLGTTDVSNIGMCQRRSSMASNYGMCRNIGILNVLARTHSVTIRESNMFLPPVDIPVLIRDVNASNEVAFITSGYVYENVICRRPSLVDPALFQPLSVRVKETRTRAWAYILGALPSTSTRGETRRLRSALSHFLPRCRRGSPGRPRPWRGARPAGSRRSRPAQPAAPASLARSDRGRLAAA